MGGRVVAFNAEGDLVQPVARAINPMRVRETPHTARDFGFISAVIFRK
jgi:hypothetical protein